MLLSAHVNKKDHITQNVMKKFLNINKLFVKFSKSIDLYCNM